MGPWESASAPAGVGRCPGWLWGWHAVGEVPSAYTLIGGTIIVAAITYQALSGTRRRPLRMALAPRRKAERRPARSKRKN